MTVTVNRSLLTIRGTSYEIGEPVARTPESILSLESLQQLVIARRVAEDGSFVTITTTKEAAILPHRPSEEAILANPRILDKHLEAYTDYLSALKTLVEVPAPAAVGHVYTAENRAYFYLRQLDTGIPSAIPYDTDRPPSHMLFHLQIAEIVD